MPWHVGNLRGLFAQVRVTAEAALWVNARGWRRGVTLGECSAAKGVVDIDDVRPSKQIDQNWFRRCLTWHSTMQGIDESKVAMTCSVKSHSLEDVRWLNIPRQRITNIFVSANESRITISHLKARQWLQSKPPSRVTMYIHTVFTFGEINLFSASGTSVFRPRLQMLRPVSETGGY